MSYDLCVFDPAAAPKKAIAFGAWLDEVLDGAQPVQDVEALSAPLAEFYAGMTAKLEPLNGPNAADENAAPANVGDYVLFPSLIEMSFSSSASETAAVLVQKLTVANKLGLYDPQGGEVYLPRRLLGGLKLAFEV